MDLCKLKPARAPLPAVLAGVRVFIADSRPVASCAADRFTTCRHVHGALTGDALLCLSHADQPLLDPARHTFPIDRSEGYWWPMNEGSPMFAWYGPNRSHEGIDFDLHDARGLRRHALVAVEDGTVRLARNRRNGTISLESLAQPGLWYIYQHTDGGQDSFLVREGQPVSRGQRLAYIWGDWRWGHLHFAVKLFGDVDAGTYRLAAGEFAPTPEKLVTVSDGMLLVRVTPESDEHRAAVSRLDFVMVDPET